MAPRHALNSTSDTALTPALRIKGCLAPLSSPSPCVCLVALPARDLTRPATCSETLVEPCSVETKTAAVLTLANWSKGPIKDLEVQLTGKFPSKKITRASGKKLKVEKQKDGILLTLDLEVADAIILR